MLRQKRPSAFSSRPRSKPAGSYRSRLSRPLFERLEDRNLLTTFMVINTLDSGSGSLREAIEMANGAAGLDRIEFAIPGAGVKTIAPTSALPPITGPVVIDGYTQPGASVNTLTTGNDAVLLIELNGANAPTVDGLTITGGGSTVRGLVINRFPRFFQGGGGRGIVLQTNGGNFIQGNFIGTDAQGMAAAGNGETGVMIANVPNNTIGGTNPADRNVISSNLDCGIRIDNTGATGNTVQGNYIGTNSAGTSALNSQRTGVDLNSAPGNTVGGTVLGAGNVISGHTLHGISINASGNKVQGNFIGLDAGGTFAIRNRHAGVFIVNTFGNVIGGDDLDDGTLDGVVHARNIISGNGEPGAGPAGGVSIAYGVIITEPNFVQGNFIGTDVTGTMAVANSFGVVISGQPAPNSVGGPRPGRAVSGNLISGNVEGVRLVNYQVRAVVQGNLIGTQADGVSPLGNGYGIITNTTNNTIGGSNPGEGNVIAFNGDFGVAIISDGAPGTGNAILGNSIHSNAGLGIDLILNGNNAQNFPVLTSVITTASDTTIQGTLASTPGATFRIEFFSNTVPDPSGFGEGQTFIGSTTVTDADNDGNISFTAIVGAIPAGQGFATATATDTTTNDTSEFSQVAEIPPVVAPTTTIVSSDHAGGSMYGQVVTFTATVSSDAGTPTGSIQFQIDGANSGTPQTLSGGTANFNTSALAAGNYTIAALFTSNDAGMDNSQGTFVQSVDQAPLTISADNKSKLAGAPLPALTASYDGFVNGDTTGSLTTLPTLSTTATATSAPGDYAITVGGAAASNYAITYVSGTLTVAPATVPPATVATSTRLTSSNQLRPRRPIGDIHRHRHAIQWHEHADG